MHRLRPTTSEAFRLRVGALGRSSMDSADSSNTGWWWVFWKGPLLYVSFKPHLAEQFQFISILSHIRYYNMTDKFYQYILLETCTYYVGVIIFAWITISGNSAPEILGWETIQQVQVKNSQQILMAYCLLPVLLPMRDLSGERRTLVLVEHPHSGVKFSWWIVAALVRRLGSHLRRFRG